MKPFKTALVGFGKIGAGYAADPAMVRHYPHATHAQILRDHPAFEWIGVADPSGDARGSAQTNWAIGNVAAAARDLVGADTVEVAVMATPPAQRLAVLDAFPNLRGVLAEKPLGETVEQGEEFIAECQRRGISLAVNLFRRFDPQLVDLAAGGLRETIGEPQAAFMTYGNGLINNGVHLIDLVHMLLGDTQSAQSLFSETAFEAGPIFNDLNFPFALQLKGGLAVMASPLDFSSYREIGLDVWGGRGRMQLLNEGLTRMVTRTGPNRAMTGESELLHETTQSQSTRIGEAMYKGYDNLAENLMAGQALQCDGETGLKAEKIIAALFASRKANGQCLRTECKTANG
ncbi:Gfo/Idh/MocA family oxidoreductase [Verrucomicrobia bacterium]|nr:Gfo/Idh/MocA family oxidoreductase [Verrucomicrobiota bacterium]MDC0219792.1 Gfo/Idh/MocA family oxidoreductase [Verrucomicrobiota bacterium]